MAWGQSRQSSARKMRELLSSVWKSEWLKMIHVTISQDRAFPINGARFSFNTELKIWSWSHACRYLCEAAEAIRSRIPSNPPRVGQKLWQTTLRSFPSNQLRHWTASWPGHTWTEAWLKILWGKNNLLHTTKVITSVQNFLLLSKAVQNQKGSKRSPRGCYWVYRRPMNVWLSGRPKEGFRPETTSRLKLHRLSHDGHHQAILYTDAEVSTFCLSGWYCKQRGNNLNLKL